MQRIEGKTFPTNIPYSCSNTVTGECLTNITAEECAELCQESDLCEAAAWTSNGSVCRPFYTENYDYVNPLDGIENSTDSNDIVFVNPDVWKYPTDSGGIVRSRDEFYLMDENGKSITTEATDENVAIAEAGYVLTRLLFQDIHGPDGRVEICDSVLINRPGTNLILRGNSDKLQWEPALSDNTGLLDLFTLVPKNQKKCSSSTPICWDGEYYLEYTGKYISKNPEDKNGNSTLKLTDKISRAIVWTLQPKDVTGYYCENEQCLPVDLQRVDFSGETARYQGEVVYRTNNCMLQCTGPLETLQTTNNTNCYYWFIPVSITVVLFFVLVVLWVKT